MDDKPTQVAAERRQKGVELVRVPAVLTAAAALSQEIMCTRLDAALVQRILEEDAACTGHFRLQVLCRSPGEWFLFWKARGKEAERIAAGPGTAKADASQRECFEGTQTSSLTSQTSARPTRLRSQAET